MKSFFTTSTTAFLVGAAAVAPFTANAFHTTTLWTNTLPSSRTRPSSHFVFQHRNIGDEINTNHHDCNRSTSTSTSVSSQPQQPSRRSILVQSTATLAAAFTTASSSSILPLPPANAAPPIAIIAEELGYFPVTNRAGDTVYVPAKVKRKSSEQSILLAQHLNSIGAVMYGAYWCPHCSHQKELFGSEAWSMVPYVECSTKGYYYDAKKVAAARDQVEGFPTWHFPSGGAGKKNSKSNKEWVSGEMPLERIVALSGFKGDFDVTLEGPEVGMSSGSCG